MDFLINIAFAAAAVFLFWKMFMPAKGVKSISTEELKSRLGEKDVQYVDVRTPAEYKGNHIRDFKNIPLHQLGSKSDKLDKSRETMLICQSGMRSSRAAKTLKKQGFTNVVNVKGGMSSWK
ncbi:MAG: rhodanese-like domain-containing protein [Alkalicoccus sp.]|uniref:Rhodanese-like domain-containing protein n=1 Tax=Alkalicoccus sp. TaxID=2005376 RepID=A0A651DLJ1_9BACI|nr:MAG: rhodanese-like domain-containing protein [Alkalicoccus sp.]